MSLYRLDLSYPDGRLVPVRDPVIGGDFLTRDRNRARSRARHVAEIVATAEGSATVIGTRIYGAGAMRESFRVQVSA